MVFRCYPVADCSNPGINIFERRDVTFAENRARDEAEILDHVDHNGIDQVILISWPSLSQLTL